MVHEILDKDLPDKIRRKDENVPTFAVRRRPGDATPEDAQIKALTKLHAALLGEPAPAVAQK
jgi:hypothetical protein